MSSRNETMSSQNIELSKALTKLLRYTHSGVAVESTQILQELKRNHRKWRELSHEELLGAALSAKADRHATDPYRFGVERKTDGIYLSMLEEAEERHKRKRRRRT